MQGAREFALLFPRGGQVGRLYLSSGSHARGKTFHIYVLPDGEIASENAGNAPLNKDVVEVYGVTGGQPGWTETYGWLHRGKWEQDFAALVQARRDEIEAAEADRAQKAADREEAERQRVAALLADY